MHEKHECHDDVASKPKRSRYLGAKCIQDLKEVKEENSSVQKMLWRREEKSKNGFWQESKAASAEVQVRLCAVHVALHHLDFVLAIALNNTALNIPAKLKVVALGHESLSVWRALGITGVVRDFHSRSSCPVASIDTLVQGAAVHAESLLLDSGTLLGCGVVGIAVAARVEGLAAAFTGVTIDLVTTGARLDLAVRAVGPWVLLGVGVRVGVRVRVIGLVIIGGSGAGTNAAGCGRWATIRAACGRWA
jgi:hypothetical protein